MLDKRGEPLSKGALNKAKANLKKDARPDMFEEEAIGRILDERQKGTPTQDYVLLKVNNGDWSEKMDHQNQKHKTFNTTIFEIREAGPDVKDKDRCKSGTFVQVAPSARMTILEYGLKMDVLVREYEIMYFFDGNPKYEFEQELKFHRENKKSDSKEEFIPLSGGGNA